jgi:putative tryptophan/tyrosine transport system substrate-binding protein
MRRREFITLLGGATIGWPFAARAQEPGRIYRLGCLIPVERESPGIAAFFDELRLHGFVEGRNLEVIPGGFNVSREQIDAKVALIVKAVPDAIISGPDRYTLAFQEATPTIPILAMSEDMVTEGLVASLARPGGKTTGISILAAELDGKRQDLLIEAVPGARKVAAVADTNTPQQHIKELQDAARVRGVEVSVFDAATREQVVPAIDTAKSAGAEALNFLASPLFTANASAFIEHVVKLRLPTMHQWPELAEEGGLLGYGPRFTEVFRQRARLTIKVLRGAKPADIPVEQPTRFELVINLKTAKAIGHEIPAGLVLRADKVIE